MQQQLIELKQQYEQMTQQLQARITALEQQIQAEKENTEKTKEQTVSAAQLAQEANKAVLGESGQVGAKYQGDVPSEPSYELLRDADTNISKLEEQMRSFEFHGYFRSDYGLNSERCTTLFTLYGLPRELLKSHLIRSLCSSWSLIPPPTASLNPRNSFGSVRA